MMANEINLDLTEINYPERSISTELPDIPCAEYQKRLDLVRAEMEREGFSHVVVYGDREHCMNLRFLTGYDPRFEESLLIVPLKGKPVLLVGNEGLAYARIAKPDLDIVLYQHFSLQGQPRGSCQSLAEIFNETGMGSGSKIGVAGYKYIESAEFGDPGFVIDAPSYIVDTLRRIGGADRVLDVTRWFTHPGQGLRIPLTVDEIASYEAVGLMVYRGMKNALGNLRLGVSEIEIAAALGYDGSIPLSYHISVGFGANAELGLGSPTSRRLRPGDFITIGFGVWGANIARTGIAAAGVAELPEGIGDALEKVYKPYARALLAWYRSLRVGVAGGEVYESVRELVEDPFFGVALNAGHQARDEEWINSPIAPGSDYALISGTMLQCDLIVAGTPPYSGIHTEDGLVLADNRLRAELAQKYPAAWERILARRRMMEQLGYELHQDVLPLSDMQGCVAPFLLRPDLALGVRR